MTSDNNRIFNSTVGQLVIYGSNGISILACICLFYCYKRSSQNISLKMIMTLGVIDFLFALSSLTDPWISKTDFFCTIEQYTIRTLMCLSLFWSSSISCLSYRFLSRPDYSNTACLLYKWFFMSLILSGGVSIAPIFNFLGLAYGVSSDGQRCVLNLDQGTNYSQWYVYAYLAGPFLLAILITLICYFMQGYLLWKSRDLIEELGPILRKLIWFPVGQIFLFGPTIIGMGITISTGYSSQILLVIEYGILHSLGLVNYIVYGFQTDKKKFIKKVKSIESLSSDSTNDHTLDDSLLEEYSPTKSPSKSPIKMRGNLYNFDI